MGHFPRPNPFQRKVPIYVIQNIFAFLEEQPTQKTNLLSTVSQHSRYTSRAIKHTMRNHPKTGKTTWNQQMCQNPEKKTKHVIYTPKIQTKTLSQKMGLSQHQKELNHPYYVFLFKPLQRPSETEHLSADALHNARICARSELSRTMSPHMGRKAADWVLL